MCRNLSKLSSSAMFNRSRIDKWVTWGLVVFLLSIISYGMYIDAPSPAPPRYHEEAYTLLDGTPCTILRGQVGFIGFTCNYTVKK